MNLNFKICYPFLILFIIALFARFFLFYSHWGDLRHGSAINYGSAAIGLFYGDGLTLNKSEQKKINDVATNYTGNYLSFHDTENRQTLTEFLPGPSILLYLLWKVFPLYNFSPYIWLQIILESLLISFFYFAFKQTNKTIVLSTTLLMAVNPVTIKYTLSMGYDFWPQFCVLVNFICVALALRSKNAGFILFFTGLLTAFTIWFRSITSLLPFYIPVFLLLYWRLKDKRKYSKIGISIAMYLFAVIISMVSLSVYRYELTGNYRPTRSTFWHSFWAGVGQFPNIYDLESSDEAIWKFGQHLNLKLADLNLNQMIDMGTAPDSLYEKTLKTEGLHFIRKYPHIILRNTLYRMAIMIAPVLYKHGKFIPKHWASYLFPIGLGLIVIWFFGMYYLFRLNCLLFWLSFTIYVYFFTTFGVFYVVGRVILPFLFINILVYFLGLKSIIRIVLTYSPIIMLKKDFSEQKLY